MPHGQRTLAAIVFSDVVNFSARMNRDEVHTLVLVQRDLELMSRLCCEHEGQVLKSTGDGLLMYFNSAVQAVLCAQEIQKAIATAATQMPSTEVLLHRIGIHLGDVFVSESDVMGDGVNIAARLQAEAEPGGICLSQVVYDVVKRRLALKASYLGPRELKNIQEAVHVYQILLAVQSSTTEVEVDPTHLTTPLGPLSASTPLLVPDSLRSQLETLLTRAMGPMAKVILDRALAEANTPRDLADRLLRHIPTSVHDSFREEARQLLANSVETPTELPSTDGFTVPKSEHSPVRTPGENAVKTPPLSPSAKPRTTPTAFPTPPAVRPARLTLTEAEESSLQTLLARAVGPMSRILVKQALVNASTPAEFVNYITRSLPDNTRASVRHSIESLLLPSHPEVAQPPQTVVSSRHTIPTAQTSAASLPATSARQERYQLITPEYLERCQAELVLLIGPMANIVMQQIKARCHPQLTRAHLIDKIAAAIPDTRQANIWRERAARLH
ncbi:MAG: adenylate/guanylate cyclase domain-containing protein [Cyanobacteria bacterium J06642_2]